MCCKGDFISHLKTRADKNQVKMLKDESNKKLFSYEHENLSKFYFYRATKLNTLLVKYF